MRLSNDDKRLLDFCKTPKTSREISEALDIQIKTVQWMIGKLKRCGLLEGNRIMEDGFSGFKYHRIEGVEIQETVKPKDYKPLGICVLGVWI